MVDIAYTNTTNQTDVCKRHCYGDTLPGMALTDRVIGRNVRELREARGMSQTALSNSLSQAGISGIYPQTIVKIEQGSRTVKLLEGLAIAEAFGVSPDVLWTAAGSAIADQTALRLSENLKTLWGALEVSLYNLRLVRGRIELALAEPMDDEIRQHLVDLAARMTQDSAIRSSDEMFATRGEADVKREAKAGHLDG